MGRATENKKRKESLLKEESTLYLFKWRTSEERLLQSVRHLRKKEVGKKKKKYQLNAITHLNSSI